MAEPRAETADLLRHVAALIERTADLDYDPSQSDGSWVCGDHGVPECAQGAHAALPWPEVNADRVLGAFQGWADREFLRVVRPYDEGRVPEMPEESFRAYSLAEWPIGEFIEALSELVTPPGKGGAS